MIEIRTSESRLRAGNSDFAPAKPVQVRPVLRPVSWTAQRHRAGFMQGLRFALPLLATDLFVLTMAFLGVVIGFRAFSIALPAESAVVLGSSLAVFLVSYFLGLGLYRNVGMHPVVELERVVTAIGLVFLTAVFILVLRSDRDVAIETTVVALTGGLVVFALPSVRHLARCCLGNTSWWRQPLILIGRTGNTQELLRMLRKEKHLGWRPIGFVEDSHSFWDDPETPVDCCGTEEDLPELIERHRIFWGMIDANGAESNLLQHSIDRYHRCLPNIISVQGSRADTCLVWKPVGCGGSGGIHFRSAMSSLIPRIAKRSLDVFVASLILFLLSPIILLLMLAVRRSGPGPIFYSQERIGLGGANFRIWKFRSMVRNADQVLKDYLAKNPRLREEWDRTQKLTNDPRITPIGRLLRKTSLDELPQLWNVLNGSMSLVGPRPIVRDEIQKYGDVFWLYVRTKPGITGMWQVSGRNHTTYQERLIHDSFYVRNWSIWLDWYILLKTFRVVVLCEGAY